MQTTNTSTAALTAASQTFQFAGRGNQGGVGKTPDEAEHQLVNERLPEFKTKTAAVRFLLDREWTVAAICQKIRYETATNGHEAGDALKPQHVNHIKTKYTEEKAIAKAAAKSS
jgi:hypothetical protein